MTTKDLENRISSAFDKMIPEDSFDKISQKISSASSDERTVINMTEKKNNRLKYYISAVAACLLLIAGISGGLLYSNNFKVASVIGIDVNPGIEITANKHDKVIDVSAVNEEGTAVLDEMDLRSTDLKVAVNAIIGSMVQKGYMTDNNSILVTVCNDDENKAINLKEEICSDIDAALAKNNADAVIIKQTAVTTDDVKKFAADNGISVGKATFILNLVKKDNTLVATELAKMSISQIAVLVTESNIDISDIADYDNEDSIWENIADSIEDVNEQVYAGEMQSSSEVIGNDAALKAAIAHSLKYFAELTEEDLEFVTCEYDHDDGSHKYEIEFVWHGIGFEYEIDAVTGNVISCEKGQVDFGGQQEICDDYNDEDHYEDHYDDDHHEDEHH